MTGRAIVLVQVGLIVLTTLAIPLRPAEAQQSGKAYRVGWVTLGSATGEGKSYAESFLGALGGRGYLAGSNLLFDVRDARGDMGRVSALVDELIALKPNVLLGWESVAQVMPAKTTSIPIVLVGVLDPVKAGLAQNLRQPGMNVTGVAQLNDQMPATHIDIMREINPRLARVGMFVDTTASGCKVAEESARHAAQAVGAVFIPYYVSDQADIQRAFSQMEKKPPEVLRIPSTSFIVTSLPQGVLSGYAASLDEIYRRAAIYVDRILKGAKAGDLPIEQPTKFELAINLRTAKALGLTIPPPLLLRADQVIE